jgi:hypothetical protein
VIGASIFLTPEEVEQLQEGNAVEINGGGVK